jgi:hypothetical protein
MTLGLFTVCDDAANLLMVAALVAAIAYTLLP